MHNSVRMSCRMRDQRMSSCMNNNMRLNGMMRFWRVVVIMKMMRIRVMNGMRMMWIHSMRMVRIHGMSIMRVHGVSVMRVNRMGMLGVHWMCMMRVDRMHMMRVDRMTMMRIHRMYSRYRMGMRFDCMSHDGFVHNSRHFVQVDYRRVVKRRVGMRNVMVFMNWQQRVRPVRMSMSVRVSK